MEWISVKYKFPERTERVLVYKTIHMGGYSPGIYIAHYSQSLYSNDYRFIIDDLETNQNNYRPLNEFSHWMPLPEKPRI